VVIIAQFAMVIGDRFNNHILKFVIRKRYPALEIKIYTARNEFMKDITDMLGAFVKGEDVIVRGTILELNLEPMCGCGDGSITLSTANYGELDLTIVGGRRAQPPRANVKIGDFIEICGIVGNENKIAVENASKHYLRIA